MTVALMVGCGVVTAVVAGGPADLLDRATEGLLLPSARGPPVGFVTFVVPLT